MWSLKNSIVFSWIFQTDEETKRQSITESSFHQAIMPMVFIHFLNSSELIRKRG